MSFCKFLIIKDQKKLINYLFFSIELQECEVFGFSLILRKLLVFHDAKFEFVKLEATTINCILEKMLVMSVNFCENSIKEELVSNPTFLASFPSI